ncbi:MAG: helix-turn-helix domain-containing protein [Phycisphaerales bacterium]|jgi:AcrR family transcriptional regulator
MRVTAEVKQSTERAIRASARRLFLRRGVDATSTRAIASAAKVAVGTLFNYFPSKEALALAVAAEAFTEGRAFAQEHIAAGRRAAREGLDGSASSGVPAGSLEEDLFTLVASDLRALAPIRAFVSEVIEASLSPFAGESTTAAATIRTERLADAAALLRSHGLEEAATPAVMHLYWSLYLGVLAHWSSDRSPQQEDTLALLDQGIRMFVGALRRDDAVKAAPATEAPASAPAGAEASSPFVGAQVAGTHEHGGHHEHTHSRGSPHQRPSR